MMRQVQRPFSLFSRAGDMLGTVRAVLSHRTSEETDEDDLCRATETVIALVPARYTPAGGFSRGMVLRHGKADYKVLVPVDLGRLWRLKCERVHTEAEGSDGDA